MLPFSGQTPSPSGPQRPQLAGGDPSTQPQHGSEESGTHQGLLLGSRGGRPLEAAAGCPRPLPRPPAWRSVGLAGLSGGCHSALVLRKGEARLGELTPSAVTGASGDGACTPPACVPAASEQRRAVPGGCVSSRACPRLPARGRGGQRGARGLQEKRHPSPAAAPRPGVVCCHCHWKSTQFNF